MRKNHPLVTLTIGFTLVGSLAPLTAFAADPAVPVVNAQNSELTQQQAIDIATKALSIDSSYQLQNVSRNENPKDSSPFAAHVTWDFNWKSGNDVNSSNITVSVDAVTGAIRNIYRYYAQAIPSEDTGSAITADAAKAKAVDWIAKLAPDKAKLITDGQQQNFGVPNANEAFSFRFNRLANGIPFPMDGFTITISKHGDLLNYNYNWTLDNSQFPSASASITLDSATKAYGSLPLTLEYNAQYGPYTSEPNVTLVYAPSSGFGFSLPSVDAATGTLLDSSGKTDSDQSATSWTALAPSAGAPLAASPLTAKEDAAALAKKILAIDDSYTLTHSSYTAPGESGKGQAAWNLNFSKPGSSSDKMSMSNINVTLDANTGDVLNYGNWGNDPAGTPKTVTPLTYEQAVSKAKDFLLKVAPTHANQLALMKSQMQMGGKGPASFYINFAILVNGIPVQGQGVNVNVNQYTGDIQNYNLNHTMQFDNLPSPAKAMSLQNAQTAYVKQYPLTLQYVMIPAQDPKTGAMSWNNPPKLVYAPALQTQGPQVLDAISGQFFAPYGNQPVHHDISDIKDHWAKDVLQRFADSGIIPVKDGKVGPDRLMTRVEAVHLLLAALRTPYMGKMMSSAGGAPANSVTQDLQAAQAAGWIDQDIKNFRPDDIITRMELADFATRIMGYTKLAAKTSVFKDPFTDIGENDKYLGDAAIVNGLGIMGADANGRFLPNEQVSLAAVATVADRIAKLTPSGPVFRPY